MRRTAVLTLALCLGVVAVRAQRSHAVDSLLVQGIEGALRHNYEQARVAFEEASRMAPEDPAGVVLLAGLLHQSAEDLSTSFDRRSFDSLLTQAEVRATSVSAVGYGDRQMWRSTARGMLSVVESQSSQWMAAIRDALASASEARGSLDRQATLADAGLPMGNYLYWRSRKTEALQWLPFIADDRVEGIRLLEWCATEGRFHRWAAVSSLIWVLHDAGNLGRAEYWARTGLASYPDNRTYLAGLAKVLESRGAHAEAARAWGRIAEALRNNAEARPYAIFSASVNQVRCVSSAGDRAAARSILASLVPPRPEDVPREILSRLQAKILEWGELRSMLESDVPSRAAAPGGR
jgi:tetratricopeptide (TPR) repeat protein